MSEVTDALADCRICGAPCQVKEFSNEYVEPTTIWLCSQHKFLGGDCPSETAYLTAEAWNDQFAPSRAAAPTAAPDGDSALVEALEYIVRQDGRNADGLIDWQRCVDRIQEVARAALTAKQSSDGEGK